jgi:hypothetical protein
MGSSLKRHKESQKFLPRHGMHGTPTYNTWVAMKSRCLNRNDKQYTEYGGRGIYICDRWLVFDNFLADMGVRKDDLSLDRVNNNGPYAPENCRWATRKQQSRNRRSSNLWKVEGVWFETAEEAGAYYGTTESSIYRWCKGYTTRQGKWRDPRPSCEVIPLYGKAA